MNRGRVSQDGYTILETLIFLAVSSFMFVIVMNLVSGQQARNEYNTAVRDFKVRLDAVINNVATGFYEYPGSAQCVASVPGAVTFSGVVTQQGSNAGCIFVGRVLRLDDDNDQTYSIYSAVGRQFTSSNQIVADYDQALPVLLAKANPDQATFPDDAVQAGVFGAGLAVEKVRVVGPGNSILYEGKNISAIGIFGSVDQRGGSKDAKMKLNIAVPRETAPELSFTTTDDQFVDRFRAKSLAANYSTNFYVNPDGGVGFCLESDRVNSHAWITIGAEDGGSVTTTVDYGDGLC